MEYLDRAAERGMKRTMSAPEEGRHEQAATTEWMEEDSEFGRNQSSGGSGSAGTEVSDRKRQVLPLNKTSVAEGTKISAEDNEEDEEARRRKTVIILKKLEQNMVSEVAGFQVNEQESSVGRGTVGPSVWECK